MAIKWNPDRLQYEYDNDRDDGKKNESDFKLALLNELSELNSNLSSMDIALDRLVYPKNES